MKPICLHFMYSVYKLSKIPSVEQLEHLPWKKKHLNYSFSKNETEFPSHIVKIAENDKGFPIQLWLTRQMQIGYLSPLPPSPHSDLLFLRYLFQKEKAQRPDKLWVLSVIKQTLCSGHKKRKHVVGTNGKDVWRRITSKISSPNANFPLMETGWDGWGLASQQAAHSIHPCSQAGYISLLFQGLILQLVIVSQWIQPSSPGLYPSQSGTFRASAINTLKKLGGGRAFSACLTTGRWALQDRSVFSFISSSSLSCIQFRKYFSNLQKLP